MGVQFGKWNFAGEPPAPPYLEKIEALLAPHGPDGTRRYSQDGISIVYGAFHSTGESRAEVQPQVAKSGALVMWDGRLDNREELVTSLRGDLSSTSPDAQIACAAYERWGQACFPKLIGDWAMSIWNPRDRSLLLAKDPIGTRPLYYTVDEREVAWSTILDPLVLFAQKKLRLEEEYIAGCFSSFPAVHLTPYTGIHSVVPSSFVRIRAGSTTVKRYWDFDPAKRIQYSSDCEYEEHFRTVLRESVRRRLRSDRPVLAELSGGMDSSSIVCMADTLIGSGRAPASELDTVSYYDDSEPNWNERPYFRRIEERRGRAGLHIDVGSENGIATFFQPGPLRIAPTSEAEAFGSRRALRSFFAANGHRVLLSGLGGDEVLGGVPIATAELADLLSRIETRKFARQIKTWALDKRKPWFHLFGETVRRFLPLRFTRAPEHLRPAPWLDPRFVARQRPALTGYEQRLHWFGPTPTFQENVATLESLRRQLGFNVLPGKTVCEKRYPYLDRDLLEFLFAVPREQLLRPGERRSLMRRSLAGVVPHEILQRKRKAFVSRRPLVGFSEHFDELLEKLDPLVTASLGIVDPLAFRRELHKARAGRDALSISLMRAIGIEMWLRNLAAGGLI